jgi:phosphatidylglycerol:prolipoprotein diacylglycerol transferase
LPNTLAVESGAVIGLATALAYIRWRRIPFARFADALAPGALVALAILALGQFLSDDEYGTRTDLPWAITTLGEMRHPGQVYEFVLVLIGLVVIQQIGKPGRRDGIVALFSIAWYSATRLFVDAFRADVQILANGYRTPQVIALIALLLALWGMSQITKGQGRMTKDG